MQFARSNLQPLFLVANFLVRLAFLDWYAAPLTDELYILDQTFFGPGRRLPMVPSLISLLRLTGADAWWSAKLISMTAGVFTIVPTFYMARKLTDSKAEMVRSVSRRSTLSR